MCIRSNNIRPFGRRVHSVIIYTISMQNRPIPAQISPSNRSPMFCVPPVATVSVCSYFVIKDSFHVQMDTKTIQYIDRPIFHGPSIPKRCFFFSVLRWFV
ncbi:hypothetical protein GPALN_005304 [Globodera pallida]|nr:hypothetical protein GPALN_005304 [Globodera pallida]